jgi:hypothetical protein
MDTAGYPETLVHVYQSTGHHTQEDHDFEIQEKRSWVTRKKMDRPTPKQTEEASNGLHHVADE